MTDLENCKTSDYFTITHGFNVFDLMRNAQKHKINDMPQIQSFQKMCDMQKETEIKARAAKAAIPDDVTAELVKDAQALGAAQVKGDGMMTFDYFIQVSKVIQKYKERLCKDRLEESVAERRALLKAEKFKDFDKLAVELSNWETMVTNNIEARLYSTLKVQKQVVDKSQNKYLMDY